MIPDNSNWLTDNIMMGGLPQNEIDFNKIKKQGITIFINLMGTRECMKGKCKPSFDYRDKKNQKNIEYYNFPIKDMSVIKTDEELIKLSKFIIKFIKQGKKVYIHCLGGSGRAGTVASIILHHLYPKLTYEEIIQLLNKKHQTRLYKPLTISPQTSDQYNQINRIITRKDSIYFFEPQGKYFLFSNYYIKPKNKFLFNHDGKNWYSTEAYFQAAKFKGSPQTTEYIKLIQEADTSHKAYLLGGIGINNKNKRGRNIRPNWVVNKKTNPTKIINIVKKYKESIKIRSDWDLVKDKIMMVILYLKFTQNKDLFDALMDTGDRDIVEFSPYDKYWATHWDNKGLNKLGKSLVTLRNCLRPFIKHFKILNKIQMPVI